MRILKSILVVLGFMVIGCATLRDRIAVNHVSVHCEIKGYLENKNGDMLCTGYKNGLAVNACAKSGLDPAGDTWSCAEFKEGAISKTCIRNRKTYPSGEKVCTGYNDSY